MEGFYERLAEILDENKVEPENVLAEFQQWDSLSALSVVAMVDENYGVTLSAEDLAGTRTAGALLALVTSKRKQ
jgi:acyl carrier protein